MSGLIGLVLLMQFGVIFSAIPKINKCSLSDSNCIKASAQTAIPAFTDGIPELGIEILDPIHMDQSKTDLPGLELYSENVTIEGLKNTVIDQLSVDMAKKQIQLVCHVDMCLRSKYKASGHLLILPISGDGDAVINIKNCQINMNFSFDVTKNKEGKDSIELKSYKYDIDVRDGGEMKLTNLFNGNKGMSDVMHAFMNENWKLMSEEFGRAIIDPALEKVFNAIKTYFSSQALEKIANV